MPLIILTVAKIVMALGQAPQWEVWRKAILEAYSEETYLAS